MGGGEYLMSTVSKFFLNCNSDTVSAAVIGLFYLMESVIKLVVPQEHVYRYIRGVQFCLFFSPLTS